VDETIVVVGAYAESVQKSLAGYSVQFVKQAKRLGTGHAVKVALTAIQEKRLSPSHVFVGYGDHMMFYTPEVVKEMERQHAQKKAAVTLVTVIHDNPDYLAWGRIIRNSAGLVEAIVEQKDATPEQRKITEQNAGFYCFDYDFLRKNIKRLKKSVVSGEFYITDLIELAVKAGEPVVAYQVPFELVGTGINTPEQFTQAVELLAK
jgi:bifunctional UDP-N-acetylglucosamine pyrophosphorylase/glucosamine-1-phosphate N-acetyltransferase